MWLEFLAAFGTKPLCAVCIRQQRNVSLWTEFVTYLSSFTAFFFLLGLPQLIVFFVVYACSVHSQNQQKSSFFPLLNIHMYSMYKTGQTNICSREWDHVCVVLVVISVLFRCFFYVVFAHSAHIHNGYSTLHLAKPSKMEYTSWMRASASAHRTKLQVEMCVFLKIKWICAQHFVACVGTMQALVFIYCKFWSCRHSK